MKIKVFGTDCMPDFENMMDITYKKENITFTNDEDYTHAILINTCMPELTIPKENVVGLAYEPIRYLRMTPEYIEYAKKHVGKYCIGDKGELPELFVEQYSYMIHNKSPELKSYRIPDKTHYCSIVISRKLHAPGHKYRHALVKAILKTKLPIHIYGLGSHHYNRWNHNDSRLMGPFEDASLPYDKYKYHICIENWESNHYFSEKIINPLLVSTIPIYMGCKNIESYFPKNVIYLSGNVNKDIELLHNIIKNYNQYDIPIDIKNVIEVTNIHNNIDKLFSDTLSSPLLV